MDPYARILLAVGDSAMKSCSQNGGDGTWVDHFISKPVDFPKEYENMTLLFDLRARELPYFCCAHRMGKYTYCIYIGPNGDDPDSIYTNSIPHLIYSFPDESRIILCNIY